jgi:hypothetical protein
MSNIVIVDRNGNVVPNMTWESVKKDYGLSLTECAGPDDETEFRLVKLIYDGTAETNWRLYVLDEEGRPLPGIAAFMGIWPPSGTDLPADAAPRISEDVWGQPEGRPNRALVLQPNDLNFTNMDGYIQHSLGSGSNYIPPIAGGSGGGTHWAWIMPGGSGAYSDVPAGFGMWDNHLMFWPVFQRTAGEEPPTPPPPSDDPIVEQLSRIADAVEDIRNRMIGPYTVTVTPSDAQVDPTPTITWGAFCLESTDD